MKRIILSISAVLALGITACGQSSNAADQVRQAESRALTALTGDNPESACAFYTVASHEDCLKGVMMVKAMGIKTSSLYPSGWQDRLAKAKVTIVGNKATVSAIMSTRKKGSTLTKVDGQWLMGD